MLDLKDHNGKIDIKSMTPEELEAFFKGAGREAFPGQTDLRLAPRQAGGAV